MTRIEAIPYGNLDERFKLSMELEKKRKQKKFKKFSDLGNCFYIEHFALKDIGREAVRI